MKRILTFMVLLVALIGGSAFKAGNDTLITRTGHINFYSDAKMEKITGDNYQVGSSLNKSTGDLVHSMLVKSFEFKNAKMGEHFNENYMESDKFPKSTFKGKIKDISKVNFSKDGTYKVVANGDLTIHGVTKNVTTNGTITVKGGEVKTNSVFIIAIKDYNITVPGAVTGKIAEEIKITVDVTYPAK